MQIFKELLNDKIEKFENYLDEYLNEDIGYQQKIADAMRYSLLNGGKRIRAMLLLGFYEAISLKDGKKAYPFAQAIEMIHAYSLIHDDLPCMDNDDFRRGKPSSHKVYGEALALLAGDSLLNGAFEIMLDNTVNFSPNVILNATKELAVSSGCHGMIGGQVIDIENEGKAISDKLLTTLHLLKTGALIKAACKIGVIISDGNDEQLKSAENFGKAIGLAFQIQDDIFDVEGEESLLGKPIGSDAKQQKTTYVTLYGLENAKTMCDEMYNTAIKYLQQLDVDITFLINFTQMLKCRKY